MFHRSRACATLAAVSLTLLGCPDIPDVPTPGLSADPMPGATRAPAPGSSAAPTAAGDMGAKLTASGQVQLADLVVGPDGVLHAFYREAIDQADTYRLFYQRSANAGASWSAPLDLSSDAGTDNVGTIQAAVDGEGRVYAVWKQTPEGTSELPESNEEGTLVYRVNERGTWGPVVAVGTANHTYSFFADADPRGEMHLVWNENLEWMPGIWTVKGGGRIRQAALSGSQPGASADIKVAPFVDGFFFDHYAGLRGYVDASGTAHWAGVKLAARSGAEPELVTWDGRTERTRFQVSDFTDRTKLYKNPVRLVFDAASQEEHLIVFATVPDRQAVLDYRGTSSVPTVVYEAPAGGAVSGLQVVEGQNGRLATLMTARDSAQLSGPIDLLLATYANGAWGPVKNLTGNGERSRSTGTAVSAGSSAASVTTYEPRTAAGAFDAAGRLNLLAVHMVSTFAASNTEGGTTGGATTSESGSAYKADLFFSRP